MIIRMSLDIKTSTFPLARFGFAHMVPIFFLNTFVIRLLTTMSLTPVCYMVFSTTTAQVDLPLPSPFSLAIV